MAQIQAIGSKGHHTFTLTVWENSVNTQNNTSNVGFTFSMVGGGYDFNWTSRSIAYTVTVGGQNFYGTFGRYDKNFVPRFARWRKRNLVFSKLRL